MCVCDSGVCMCVHACQCVEEAFSAYTNYPLVKEEREREREREREGERERKIERERETDRQTERKRERGKTGGRGGRKRERLREEGRSGKVMIPKRILNELERYAHPSWLMVNIWHFHRRVRFPVWELNCF